MSRIRKLFLLGCRTWSVNTKEHIVNKYLETSFSEKCLDLKESPITDEAAKCRRHLAWETKNLCGILEAKYLLNEFWKTSKVETQH